MTGRVLVRRLVQIGFVAGVAAVWHLLTVSGTISSIFLPALPNVMDHFLRILMTGEFWPDLRITLFELASGFTIAATAGTVVGYLVSRTRYRIRVFDPLFAGLYAIPTILFYPVYVLLFGIGPESKIAMGATIGFFPIALSTIAGFGNVDRVYVTLARSMGASDAELFRFVLLPAALPVIVTGFRMGFILAFLSILGSETVTSISGIGHRIVTLAELMHTQQMFAYILFVIIVAALLNAFVSLLEARAKGAAA